MLFRASVLCVAATLINVPLAVALPTTSTADAGSSLTLSARDDTQCEAGKAFYTCYINHFRGCCSVDPCALQDGCPDQTDDDNDDSQPTPGTCPGQGKKTRLFQPQMQTLILPDTDHPIPEENFHLSKSNTTERQQIASWTLPAKAKDCSVGWSIPEKRNFSAGHTARVTVVDNDDDERLGSADFSFWPETPGPRSNLVAAFECKEKVALRLSMVLNDQVFLEQNEETGWWVEYSC